MPSKTDIIESLLFASDKPLPLKKLAQFVELSTGDVLAELDVLREEKERIGSIQLIEVAGGWQLATKPAFSPFIRQLRDAPRQRLSRAAFEVLAIAAYRQPVTRAEIEGLRGVDCAGPVQFLLEKKLLAFAGRKDSPGRPHLYATTPEFLDHFGLRDVRDLPSLDELAELNGGALIHDGDRLFNRGAMTFDDAPETSTVEFDRTHSEAESIKTESQEAQLQDAESEMSTVEIDRTHSEAEFANAALKTTEGKESTAEFDRTPLAESQATAKAAA